MNNDFPIGVFDSGLGGLSILNHIHAFLPQENLIYVADSANLPYGDKGETFILQRATVISDFLIENKVKAIVIACNTATAVAVDALRKIYTLPIIGIEPAVKPAVSITKTNKVGVLATSGTLMSNKFRQLITNYGTSVELFIQPCDGWVELVEENDLTIPLARTLVEKYLLPLIAQKIDVLVLGCTHYPFLIPLIKEIAGPTITLLDPGRAIARELEKQLAKKQVLNVDAKSCSINFYTSGSILKFVQGIHRLWHGKISAVSAFKL